ncbi:magnesium transporter [Cellulomonas sp. RIT-PI-Y]|uniref:magnesium transporter n=1 Tax=Cellulomonas sp. RIT-PI-Y TaxID=3035297 RepID=UPI0021D97631|nr:magnesium transporter [Cellulomonas sp. RIT-PI-Y]
MTPTTTLTSLDLHDVLSVATPRSVEIWLDTVTDRRTRADQLAELSDAQVRALIRLLRPDTARELFGSLDPHTVAEVLIVLPPTVAAGLVDSMEPDTAAEVLRAVDDDERAHVLSAMAIARSAVIRGLLAWPEDSAAAQMNPEVVTVLPTQSVREAVDAIQGQSPAEGTTEVYVTTPDDAGLPILRGVVSFRDLVLAPADGVVADLMRDDPVCVEATADQERAARLLGEHRLSALPVVDDGRLIGVLSPDDIADIMQEETTEDAARQGGSEPLEVPYLRASPWLLWRKRVVWMLALFLAEMYTGSVLRAFEDELATVVALTFFVPLLIGTGGNAGTQITTTLIRAMATGEVRLRDVGRVLRKELTTGTMIAVTMAAMALIRAWTLGVGVEVGVTVAVSAAAIVLWASLIASVLPLVLRKIGIDPAVVSGPMIATIVDGTGLMIYFTVARLFISALS